MSLLPRIVAVACLVVGLAVSSVAGAVEPARPGVVRSEKLSSTQVLITWRDRATNENLYLVQRRLVTSGRFLTRGILPAGTTEFVDVVKPRTIYIYRVVARSIEGETRHSANCFVNRTPPNKPSTIAVRLIALDTARITWSDRSLIENGFRIERRQDGMPTFEVVGQVGRSVESFIDTTLKSATTYTYRVRALGRPSRCIAHSASTRERTVTSKGGVRVLDVEIVGNSSGNVVSVPEGINCGPERRRCSAEFRAGETITLFATATGLNSEFRRWKDQPRCKGQRGPCRLRMIKDRTIRARFREPAVAPIAP